jgi:hypothetical protein
VDANVYYDPKSLRKWIEEGKLACAVLMIALDKPGQEIITKANLNKLPAKSPYPEGMGMGPMGPMGPISLPAQPAQPPQSAPPPAQQ